MLHDQSSKRDLALLVAKTCVISNAIDLGQNLFQLLNLGQCLEELLLVRLSMLLTVKIDRYVFEKLDD